MNIAIGTKNPTKINAVKNVFGQEMTYHLFEVPSGVSSQPFSDEETIQGAINRSERACKDEMDLGIGLEGGVTETDYGLFLCNWGALSSPSLKKPIIAGGARILLPHEIATMLKKEKIELAEAMERFTHKKNVRSNEGAIGIFTSEMLTRTTMFEHVVRMLYGQYQFHQKQ
ncbi:MULTISPECIES: DUF84 family protein [Bacillaceae]|uniref:DUF84 family protein n=1 Tax=Bacillaceae TaxID=186817 RepID=UPI0010527138|nr:MULTISPECIES: DUF84 family protein [Bacillaceae]MDT2045157.1 DUF84 family protein [Priestia flexa]TDB51084.1 DUF84 family protein [Bacillus sp. CBEL-1]USY54763.1 DUF84 family protein [Bacillus sp. 1780r2a1]